MAKKTKKKKHPAKNPTANPPTKNTPAKKPGAPGTGRDLAILAVLGALAALWALFLWMELVKTRNTGAAPFCAFGESDCGLLWDAAFASLVHRFTGLPVAAWGLVWGVVAFVVPLFARGDHGRHTARRMNAVKWTAVAGLAGLVSLLAVSALEGLFCTSCALTYVLTLAYAGVVFFKLKPQVPLTMKGLEIAAAATVGVFVLLLYPGLNTPRSQAREDQRMLAEAARRQAAEAEKEAADSDPAGTAASHEKLDKQLEDFLNDAQPELKQEIANSLTRYRSALFHEEDPRFLHGSYNAPVRITEFTDALCSHCANLHFALEQMKTLVPEDVFSVDARHYPLDGNCNDQLPVRGPETVRCVAARAQICMESSPRAVDFTSAMFERQRGLTTAGLDDVVRPFMSPSALRTCMKSAEIEGKLADDVAYAGRFNPRGTPLVLINGREVTTSALTPFIFVMVMARGEDGHPLFASLPPADPDALTSDGHEGHDH